MAFIIIMATRVGFLTGYLVILAIIGLAYDAYSGRVPRVFLPISIVVLCLSTVTYYYFYVRQFVDIADISRELRVKNERQVKTARNLIAKEKIDFIQRIGQDFTKYTKVYHYYTPGINDSYNVNIYIDRENCSIINKKNTRIISMHDTKIKYFDKKLNTNKYLCKLTAKSRPINKLLHTGNEEDISEEYSLDGSIRVSRRNIFIGDKKVAEYLTGSVSYYPILPWPIIFCGNGGGLLSQQPKYFCDLTFRGILKKDLDTRPRFVKNTKKFNVIAAILDLEPRETDFFPNFELSEKAKVAINYLGLTKSHGPQ
ncbi:hypothetical protein [Cohaesibacter marisflavi]|nr:hypothetical protein [Cohaesibacter marisflavi]